MAPDGWVGYVILGMIVVAVAAVAWFTFRSLRRWQGPPADEDSEAGQTLTWLTHRHGPQF